MGSKTRPKEDPSCATQETMRFETDTALALESAFHGGFLWLEKMDGELGLCEAVSERVPE